MSTDEGLEKPYHTLREGRPVHVTLNSNEKIVEHREHRHESPESPIDEQIVVQPFGAWYRMKVLLQDPISEFFGVFFMILFGDGVVAQVVLSDSTKGDYQSISWCWGYVNPDILLSTRVTFFCPFISS